MALLPSCAPAAPEPAGNRESAEVHELLAEMAFLKGRDHPLLPSLPVAPRSVALCMDQAFMGKLNLGGIMRVTGDTPFVLNRQRTRCEAQIALAKPAGGEWNFERKTTGCAFYLQLSGAAVVKSWTMVTHRDPRHRMKCAYRIALFYQGYEGALEMPDARLFKRANDTMFVVEETLVSDWVPVLVGQLSLCRFRLPRGVTREGLMRDPLCRRGGSTV